MGGEDLEGAGATIGLEVDAGDEAVASEDGHAVVAVDALGGGLEDLEDLVEAEELADARALPEEGVEGGEEDGAIEARAGATEAVGEVEVLGADPAGDALAVIVDERAGDDRARLAELGEGAEDRGAPAAEAPGGGEGAGGGPAVADEGAEEEAAEGFGLGEGAGAVLVGDDALAEVEGAEEGATAPPSSPSRSAERRGPSSRMRRRISRATSGCSPRRSPHQG